MCCVFKDGAPGIACEDESDVAPFGKEDALDGIRIRANTTSALTIDGIETLLFGSAYGSGSKILKTAVQV